MYNLRLNLLLVNQLHLTSMLDFMSELFILGFGAKSVVELFEDSVDIGEELR